MSVTENKQSSKLEAAYNSLAEELQRRCVCPSCQLDNLEAVSALLLATEDKWCLLSWLLLDQRFKMLSLHCNDAELRLCCVVWIWINLAFWLNQMRSCFCIEIEKRKVWEPNILIVLSYICFSVDCISYWPIISIVSQFYIQ